MNAEALASLASMEGLDVTASRPVFVPLKKAPPWYGYLISAAVGLAAIGAHYFFPSFSAPILAILLGALLRNFSIVPVEYLDGCKTLVRRVIPITIILTGATLNLSDIARGLPHVAVVLVAVAVGTGISILVGRMLGTSLNTARLVGAGTSICGNSAIIATAPVMRASDNDLVLSLGAINVLGLLIMVLLPIAGAALHLNAEQFGVWAGATVHAVPQAVTTGFAFGPEAGALAALVKLVRVSMLAPYVLVLAFLNRRQTENGTGAIQYSSLVPPFLWGFGALALVGTFGLFPDLTFRPLGSGQPFHFSSVKFLGAIGGYLLVLSMAAMGLEVNLKHLFRTGGPALATALTASILQCLATWATIRILI